jgi:thienamycin biosynthesis protein ThnN
MPIADERFRAVLDLHFHPEHGSAYWLARQERLGFAVLDRVRAYEEIWLLGQSLLEDLRRFPIRDFIPNAFHNRLDRFIVGETAGTSGEPRATAYRDDEFQAAFVTPFLEAASAAGFPRGLSWLWVGPSGPHIIGKAVRELARQTGSMDPFSIDFDPRWAKRLAEGSLASKRYLEHVAAQAIDVLEREAIGVLFTTPPALTALAEKMSNKQRESIRGVHYGGLSITAAQLNRFRELYPNAVHLSGYGNTLFGVVMEVTDRPRASLDYFPRGDRVCFEVVAPPGDNGESNWPPSLCERGQTGRVLFHRLDESFLLTGVLERDEAERIPPSSESLGLGWNGDGLRDPRPPACAEGGLRIGLY